jgi:hypothetical protein
MAAKKKTKKKTIKAKQTTSSRTAPKKKTGKKKVSAKKKTIKRKSIKKPIPRKVAVKTPNKRVREREQIENPVVSQATSGRSGRQSGDLQGLSRREEADSESIDELLEEGNTFEAGVVTGVEEAGNDETEEVHTHEVPVDDVPEEYLDED